MAQNSIYRAVDCADPKREYTGTAKEIVKSMAASDYITPQKDVWMYEVQERLNIVYGKKIRVVYGLYTKFLKELKRVNMISLEVRKYDDAGKPIWCPVE